MPTGVVGDGEGRDPRVGGQLARHRAQALAGGVLERAGPGHELDERGAAIGACQRLGEGHHQGRMLPGQPLDFHARRHPIHTTFVSGHWRDASVRSRGRRLPRADRAASARRLERGPSMLHDPSHYEPPPIAEEIKLSQADRDVLRALASELAAGAALPVHAEKARLWQKLNDLQSERPMVWINEIPWHEMNVDDELTLRTEHPWAREPGARPAAHALPVAAPAGGHDRERLPRLPAGHPQHRLRHRRGRGRRQDRRGQRHRLAALPHPDPRPRRPREDPACRWSRTTRRPPEFRYQAMCEVFDDIMPVRKVGPDAHLVHALGLPDPLVGHRGGHARPDRAAGPGARRRGADGRRLDGRAGPVRSLEPALAGLQQHAHRLRRLRLHAGRCPATPTTPHASVPHNMWGCSNAQIFSEVSPRDALGVRAASTTCAGCRAGG